MCGLIYIKSNDGKNAVKRAWHRYTQQKLRGSQGYGFVDITNGQLGRGEIESEIKQQLNKITTSELLFHHRYPTSTPNLIEATHPIVVKNRKLKTVLYVAHNGVITNADELRAEHIKLGYKYTTEITKQMVWKSAAGIRKSEPIMCFNDSEALAIDLALYLRGGQSTLKSDGSIAFIALETDKQGKPLNLIYGRNWKNPLVVEKKKEFTAIKSQGAGEEIEADKLYIYNYATDKTTINDCDIGVKTYPVAAYNYGQQRPFGFQPTLKTDEQTAFTTPLEDAYEKLEDVEQEILDLQQEREWLKQDEATEEVAAITSRLTTLAIERYDLELEITALTANDIT